jgi:hypothetical protein
VHAGDLKGHGTVKRFDETHHFEKAIELLADSVE